MKAWLIIRDWIGDHAAVHGDRIVCLLNPRLTPEKVGQTMEQLYVNERGSLQERVAYAKSAKSWPYRPRCGSAETESGKTVPWAYSICCGHNPWFHARLVKNIEVITDESDNKTLKWEEVQKPVLSDL